MSDQENILPGSGESDSSDAASPGDELQKEPTSQPKAHHRTIDDREFWCVVNTGAENRDPSRGRTIEVDGVEYYCIPHDSEFSGPQIGRSGRKNPEIQD